MLGKFEIWPGSIRLPDGRTPKGYYLSAFKDAFARYLPPENATPPQLNNDGHCGAFQNATPDPPVAFSKLQKPLRHSDCGGVAFSKGGTAQKGTSQEARNSPRYQGGALTVRSAQARGMSPSCSMARYANTAGG